MKLTVSRTGQEAERIKSFEFRAENGDRLPAFTPGSHVSVGVVIGDGRADERQYSLLSDPSDRSKYEIAVLLEQDGRGGSKYMHAEVHEGDVLEVSEPRNDFPLAEDAQYTILIAGGIGITPILAMIRGLVCEDASFEVHYAARSPGHMAYGEEVLRLAGDRTSLYLSEDPSGSRLDLWEVLSGTGRDTHVYACGPNRLIQAAKQVAAERGWPPEQLHFESFGPRVRADDRGIQVELSYSGSALTVGPTQTILDAVLEAGVWAPYECRRGECGMCVTQVLEGEPDHRDVCLTEAEREVSMCTCVSRAKGQRLILAL